LLLHFVGKLIFIDIWRKKLESRKNAKDQNCREGNRFDSPCATLFVDASLLISPDLQHQCLSKPAEACVAGKIRRNFSYFYATTVADGVSSASVVACSERATLLWNPRLGEKL
jgi:hypothetical protein